MKTRGKQMLSAWEGDWEKRVDQRIEELGYSSYLDYLQARRGHSYEDLAEELSRGRSEIPIAPVQLEKMHSPAVGPDERDDAILDSFARLLRGELRRGWGIGKYWETDVETLHLPLRRPGEIRPYAVIHSIVVDGRIAHTITIPNE